MQKKYFVLYSAFVLLQVYLYTQGFEVIYSEYLFVRIIVNFCILAPPLQVLFKPDPFSLKHRVPDRTAQLRPYFILALGLTAPVANALCYHYPWLAGPYDSSRHVMLKFANGVTNLCKGVVSDLRFHPEFVWWVISMNDRAVQFFLMNDQSLLIFVHKHGLERSSRFVWHGDGKFFYASPKQDAPFRVDSFTTFRTLLLDGLQ